VRLIAEFIGKVDGHLEASLPETCVNDGTGGQSVSHVSGSVYTTASQSYERILINFSRTWAWHKKDRGPTGQGNWKKSGNLNGQGKVRGKYFFGKVRENEKLVPPDVRFAGIKFGFHWGSAPDPAGDLTVLPQTL